MPFVLAICLFTLVHWTPLDHRVSDWFFDSASNEYPFRHSWLFETVLHDWAKNVAIALLLLIIVSLPFVKRDRRANLITGIFVMLLCTAVISTIKYLSPVHCPYNLLQYGGQQAGAGRCWPSGHASVGFAWFGLYFGFRMQKSPWAIPILVITIAFGLVLTLSQTVRGAHFLSHGLWTGLISWYVCLLLTGLAAYLGQRLNQG